MGNLLAVSDLHVGYKENRDVVRSLRPLAEDDWLIVAGDVAERLEHVAWTLKVLTLSFSTVIWAPGNHELWTSPKDPDALRGATKYDALVEMCRALGVLTPEDPYPTWDGGAEPITVASLFTLYDYSFRAEGLTAEQALAQAYDAGIVATDEALLHPDPFPSRAEWCRARVEHTRARLDAELPEDQRTVLVSHWPLHPTPTKRLRYPEFAQWCGTTLTADWHLRYRAAVAVYGHLHIPLRDVVDGVPFQEVSLGYPREWKPRSRPHGLPRLILPAATP
ncbi:metallophosphoesterase family protein [Cryptosporangium aurantiacum]|uniref:3',5'-cyclic AMP phosphodiesterase CpdA n=1 Tax=Cryptosporangium aurantiacum TaxID=134849 RepID=A0A1M7R949_9ACTN|nr:metallophosphoesterase [Cryptosporangium aurantiacum]SHN42629.1 3',5'-cyclic AMP phosphodiesterase CpdA [Cryptosporangium aurantiacum]